MAFHGAFSLLLQCIENLAGEVEQLTLQGGKLALKVFNAVTVIQEKRSVVVEVHCTELFGLLSLDDLKSRAVN